MDTSKEHAFPDNGGIEVLETGKWPTQCGVLTCNKQANIEVGVFDYIGDGDYSLLCFEHAYQTATEFLEYVKEAMRGKD